MSTNSSRPFVLECPRNFEAVREASRSLRAYLASNGIDEQQLAEWELIAVEAGNNAAQYISPENPGFSQPIRFVVNLSPECVEVAITDHSENFEWPDEVSLPNDESESGRGLFLISELTDSVRYLRGHNENFLIMRKLRPTMSAATDVQRDSSMEMTVQMMTEELVSTYESLAAIFRFSSEGVLLEAIDTAPQAGVRGVYRLTNGRYLFTNGSGVYTYAPGEGTLPLIGGSCQYINRYLIPTCPADFDGDGFVTGADFDAFVQAFEAGDTAADFDGDGFITGIDFDEYVQAFESGC